MAARAGGADRGLLSLDQRRDALPARSPDENHLGPNGGLLTAFSRPSGPEWLDAGISGARQRQIVLVAGDQHHALAGGDDHQLAIKRRAHWWRLGDRAVEVAHGSRVIRREARP